MPIPNPETDPGTPRRCANCREQRTFHHSTRAWGPYAGTLRKLIHRFKFSGHRRLAHPLSSLLEKAYRARPDPFSPSCLVPVPSHPRRRRKRGFDQTLLLTRTLARRLDLPVFPGLRRSRPTLPQSGLDLKARRRNVRNAFRLRQARRLRGEDLVLVDDILTTGATVREICKVLKRDGKAGRILILTVARVVQRSSEWTGDIPVAGSGDILAADEEN
ncbi:MAG: ComF family protein [Acidobacteriota bacterium]|nr:ComF family protein [Acidobacteriota bacterium]